ncbi:hypothetical protein LguiA_001968 [Lonicera macranthoides]
MIMQTDLSSVSKPSFLAVLVHYWRLCISYSSGFFWVQFATLRQANFRNLLFTALHFYFLSCWLLVWPSFLVFFCPMFRLFISFLNCLMDLSVFFL